MHFCRLQRKHIQTEFNWEWLALDVWSCLRQPCSEAVPVTNLVSDQHDQSLEFAKGSTIQYYQRH